MKVKSKSRSWTMFEGAYVAMVTDFKDGRVDLEAVRSLAGGLIEEGADGLVPVGCTGEAATLSMQERSDVIKAVLEARGDRREVKVVAGTGTNSTAGSVELTLAAQELGVDGAMLITPYYNKPTQAGLIKHYGTVAEEVDLPLVLYNVPGRTAVNMLPETVIELAGIDNIVAVKEASGSVDQVSRIIRSGKIIVLSGDDSLTLPMLAVGARGVVSVVGNVAAGRMAEMVRSYLQGDQETARRLHFELLPLMHVLFVETNPGPVKEALRLMGHGTGEMRAPLVGVSQNSSRRVQAVLAEMNMA
jgi:4-hydroxy-tetrahydrodipicolinate synthase